MTSPVWRKSRRSTEGTTAQCVETAKLAGAVGVRGSRRPEGGHLVLTAEQFATLIRLINSNGPAL
ncbi:DUF397 domain-containing protein [Actinomadura keratinilytica]|jgi:hypothetical protein|uniref:DUF397 domain-containing protein n=1 Tax=Actinomadura keratinilytica TaxID=547461 RepID=A0ABP7YFW2_9ACTN